MNPHFRKRNGEQGYVLLVLILIVSLLSIGLLAMIESVEFQIKRDREEEFIHRGVEYSRAVRRYVKKFGRYPPSVEALQSSNDLRFLRKRYKDPLTGKDFKVLYYGDIPAFNPPASVAQSAGIPIPSPNAVTAQDRNGQPQAPPGGTPGSGSTDDSTTTSQVDQSASDQADLGAPESAEDIQAKAALAEEARVAAEADAAAEKIAGTRVIVGVTSYSDRESIRVFNKKNHYNQWQFIYDPSTGGALMMGPNQPLPMGARQNEEAPTSNAGVNPGQN